MEILILIKKSNFLAKFSDLIIALYPRKLNYLLFRCRTNPNVKFEYDPVELVMIRDEDRVNYVKKPLDGDYHIYSIFIDRLNPNVLLQQINDYGITYAIKSMLLENYGYIKYKNPELDYLIKKHKLNLPFDEYDSYLMTKYKNDIDGYIEEYLDVPITGLIQNEFKGYLQYKNVLHFDGKYAIYQS